MVEYVAAGFLAGAAVVTLFPGHCLAGLVCVGGTMFFLGLGVGLLLKGK